MCWEVVRAIRTEAATEVRSPEKQSSGGHQMGSESTGRVIFSCQRFVLPLCALTLLNGLYFSVDFRFLPL